MGNLFSVIYMQYMWLQAQLFVLHFHTFQIILNKFCVMQWHNYILYMSVQRHRVTLQWRHNGRDGVSNHQPRDWLLNRLFRRRSKKTSKLRVTGLCAGNSPHKCPVTRKMFSFDDVIMNICDICCVIYGWFMALTLIYIKLPSIYEGWWAFYWSKRILIANLTCFSNHYSDER